ncbi:MAG TPA: TRAP transporter small permease subunit [Burkholderiales bacterium]|nr:TRAP transporter small permease subunit [Burkholderiales bacterium]
MQRAALMLESVSVRLGVAVAWLGIPLMILTAASEPLARWAGWRGDAPFSDASTVAFLATTMISFGYAYAAGAHVRLDVLSRRFPPRLNAAIELAGTALILLPLCAVIVVDGIDSTWRSFLQGERWADTAWALQWAVRLWVPLGFALLMAAGIAAALRALLSLSAK